MLLATASATAAATTTASSATTTAVFCEQILERKCTIDNDATSTTGDNERERGRRDGTGGNRGRWGSSTADSGHLPELGTTESVHDASNDATANPRTAAYPDSLVDTH